MELKPIKEKNEILYPTIKEVPKSCSIKEALLAATIMPFEPEVCAVAIMSYVPTPLLICKLIRNISIIITILSSVLLFVNKIKINKSIRKNDVADKLKILNKHRKVKWWILGISVTIILIASIFIVCLENHM